MARYCAIFQKLQHILSMHDFSFYRLHIRQARYIAGFGKMGWMKAKIMSISKQPSEFTALETSMIAHMNADHAESMLSCIAKHFHNVKPSRVQLDWR